MNEQGPSRRVDSIAKGCGARNLHSKELPKIEEREDPKIRVGGLKIRK